MKNKSTHYAILLIMLMVCGISQATGNNQNKASPAQALFTEATNRMKLYNGFSNVDLEALQAKYQAQLEAECHTNAQCAIEKSVPILQSMVLEISDKHTNYLSINLNPTQKASTKHPNSRQTASSSIDDSEQLPSLELVTIGVYRLKIPAFNNEKTADRIHQLVNLVNAQKGETIIVDLRDNQGGTPKQCAAGVGAFIGNFERLSVEKYNQKLEGYRDGVYYEQIAGKPAKEVLTLENPTQWTGKLAVMVNRVTASCAEFFAQDIQLYSTHPIIGETTYGVGNTSSVVYDLSNGDKVQVTTAQVYETNGTAYLPVVTPNVISHEGDLISQAVKIAR